MMYLIILLNLCWAQPQQQLPVVKSSSEAPIAPAINKEARNTLNLSDFNGNKSLFVSPKDGYGAEYVRFNFSDSELKNATLDIKKKAVKRELKNVVMNLFSEQNIITNSLTKKVIEELISSSLKELETSVDSAQNDNDLQFFKLNNIRGYLIRSLVHKYLSQVYANVSSLQLENKNLKSALDSLESEVIKDKQLDKKTLS